MVKPISEYTKEELEAKCKRTAETLRRYEEELELRKQEIPLGIPLKNTMLAYVGGVYKYAFASENSKLVFDKRLEEYVKALQKLAKGEQIDIKVLLPLLNKGYVAMDEDKRWYWFKHKPTRTNTVWTTTEDEGFLRLSNAFNLKPADDWRESLTECGL